MKTSDKRYKNIIDADWDALEIVSKLNPVKFRWNQFAHKKHPEYSVLDTNYGLIAQDSVDIMDNLVIMGDDGIDKIDFKEWKIDYEALVPILLKAIQELNSKIEELETDSTEETSE